MREPAMTDDSLYFLPLGGAGEIGMNLNVYGSGGRWLIVDCGMTFADESLPGVDLVVPDPTWLAERADRLLGIVVTHAHEDHLGAIHLLWPKLRCPVWATPFAANVLRAKLAEADLTAEVPLHVHDPAEVLQIGPFRISMIGVTHSIPEAQALKLETPAGTVLHTGDWKLDDTPLVGPVTDQAALARAGDQGVLALIGDSTNIFRAGESGSESAVREVLTDLARDRPGRVVVTSFASNVARLSSVAFAAAETGRHLVLVGRSLWRYYEAARQAGYLADMTPPLTDRDVGHLPPDKVMALCTGCQGEPRGAMARIAARDHPAITLDPPDVVIFSSKIIPGNERALGRLHNALSAAGHEVITEKDHAVHVSGHPARDELARMYRWIRPRIAVPVHGEARHLIAHARFAEAQGVKRTLVVSNGDLVRLGPDGPAVVETVFAGRLAVDAGGSLLPTGDPALTTRRRMAYNGVASVSLAIDAAGRPVGRPRVSLVGVAGAATEVRLAAEAAAAVEVVLADAKPGQGDDEIAEAARRAVRRTVRLANGRRPVTAVHVLRVPVAETGAPLKEEVI